MGFEKVRHIDLPKICDPRGNLSFLENGGVVPFPIARTYWVYDVPGGKKRFGHAFHRQEELIISLSGTRQFPDQLGGADFGVDAV